VALLYKKGDLVHIPQAVTLIDCANQPVHDPQMTIPLRVEETSAPKVGVVTDISKQGGYIRVYCDGNMWSVKNDSVYILNKGEAI
jgi:membrane protein implicated in regulation of membrane protease activity